MASLQTLLVLDHDTHSQHSHQSFGEMLRNFSLHVAKQWGWQIGKQHSTSAPKQPNAVIPVLQGSQHRICRVHSVGCTAMPEKALEWRLNSSASVNRKKAKHLGHHSWAWPCFLHCWALPLPKASPSGLHSTTKSFQTSISHQGPLSHHPTGEKRFLSCVMECQAPTTKSIDMEHLVRRAKEKFLYPFRQMLHLLHPSALPFALCQQQSDQLCNRNCCQMLRFKGSNSAVVALLRRLPTVVP